MCTSLIGRLFQSVGFPVLPEVSPATGDPPPPRSRFLRGRRAKVQTGVFRRRDPSLLTPRDFDMSPYFEVVKFEIVGSRGFDYQRIKWAEHTDAAEETPERPAAVAAGS